MSDATDPRAANGLQAMLGMMDALRDDINLMMTILRRIEVNMDASSDELRAMRRQHTRFDDRLRALERRALGA